MFRPLLALSALALAATSAAAATTYSAKPAAPAESPRIIARDVSWSCGPEACVAATDKSRPLVLCQALAKKAGRIESFTVDGRAMAATELDRCNASAKDGAAQSLAAQ